jgi:hypothetical protein
MALRLSGLRHPPVSYTPGPASAAPSGRNLRRHTCLCRMARLSGLRDPPVSSYIVGPASAAPPGDDRGTEPLYAGRRLTPCPSRVVRPAVDLPTCATAGADGLKIAETFPEGRGSPHGCGLRAVFCTDAASARPEACRDKSKVPRSGDFAGRSPGVQGAAATGRPRAPCAMPDITQTINRERNFAEVTRDKRFCPAESCKPITVSTAPRRRIYLRPGKRSAAGR